MAALAGVETAVRLHVRRGDDLDARDSAGMTALMLAASKDKATVCTILLEAGADPRLTDPSGRNALSIAKTAGAESAVSAIEAALPQKSEAPASCVSEELVLDEDWEVPDLSAWENEEDGVPPEADYSLAKAAAALHKAISAHAPVDNAEGWDDFEVLLPDRSTALPESGDRADAIRYLLLRAVREGSVPENTLIEACSEGGEEKEGWEKLLRMAVAELGAETDERAEEGDEPFVAAAGELEDLEVSSAISFMDDLDPWRCDPARLYAKEMRTGRLLTAEEEVLLGREMEEGLSAASAALASWPEGVSAVIDAGEMVRAGKAAPEDFFSRGGDEPGGDEEASTAADDQGEDGIDGVGDLPQETQEFLERVEEIARHSHSAGQGGAMEAALSAAIGRSSLSPAFLCRLSRPESFDRAAKAFAAAVERYAKARESMTVCNLRLVYNVVKRYQGLGLTFDDLLQEGNIGLLKAVERYDWRRGFKFSTYATWWIRQNASRAVADAGRTIRLPVHVHEKLTRLRREADDAERRTGKPPSDSWLAQRLSMSVGTVANLRARATEPVSLDSLNEYGEALSDYLANCTEWDPETLSERASLIRALERALADLDPRSAEILTLRYGLDGTGSRTLEETGEHYGVTRERIRQIEGKALKKLAHPSRARALADYLYADGLGEENREEAPDFVRESDEVPESSGVDARPRGQPRKTISELPTAIPADSRVESCSESLGSNKGSDGAEDEKRLAAKKAANDETARRFFAAMDSSVREANALRPAVPLPSAPVRSFESRTDRILAYARECGAFIEDGRGEGEGLLVRLPVERDARTMRLARELLAAGFKQFPGLNFRK